MHPWHCSSTSITLDQPSLHCCEQAARDELTAQSLCSDSANKANPSPEPVSRTYRSKHHKQQCGSGLSHAHVKIVLSWITVLPSAKWGRYCCSSSLVGNRELNTYIILSVHWLSTIQIHYDILLVLTELYHCSVGTNKSSCVDTLYLEELTGTPPTDWTQVAPKAFAISPRVFKSLSDSGIAPPVLFSPKCQDYITCNYACIHHMVQQMGSPTMRPPRNASPAPVVSTTFETCGASTTTTFKSRTKHCHVYIHRTQSDIQPGTLTCEEVAMILPFSPSVMATNLEPIWLTRTLAMSLKPPLYISSLKK